MIAAVEAALRREAALPVRAQAAATAVQDHGNARWVGIYSVDDSEVRNEAWAGPAAPAYPRFAVTEGLTSHAIAAGAIAVSNDTARDPRYLANQDDSGSELIVPIVVDGRVIGTLDLESDRVGAFSGESIARFEAAAQLLAALWLGPS
ncbi:MAG TPA: GAF domain-containing protein [Mycobacteriales bacterium]|nr:GAF domain-containing protein [Mycobacteriales bacterium]